MSWDEIGDTFCPIARALAIVGDRWTMLIMRELFLGVRRFEEFQAQIGMSSHLLASRLKRLERDGIVVRRKYNDRPQRHEYRLTEKGLDLYPVLLSLKLWGEKWAGFEGGEKPALEITHRDCGHEIGVSLVCGACAIPFGPRDASVVLGKAFAEERHQRRFSFEESKRR
jgi:DNA-binding HxlR family transcriptional regulator